MDLPCDVERVATIANAPPLQDYLAYCEIHQRRERDAILDAMTIENKSPEAEPSKVRGPVPVLCGGLGVLEVLGLPEARPYQRDGTYGGHRSVYPPPSDPGTSHPLTPAHRPSTQVCWPGRRVWAAALHGSHTCPKLHSRE